MKGDAPGSYRRSMKQGERLFLETSDGLVMLELFRESRHPRLRVTAPRKIRIFTAQKPSQHGSGGPLDRAHHRVGVR